MKFEELKNDSYVTWQANRMFKAWNTFGKVIRLTENEVTILTYDDLKETTLSKSGEAVQDEIELITKDEFENNLKLKLAELNTKKVEAEIEYNTKIKNLDSLIKGANSALGNEA